MDVYLAGVLAAAGVLFILVLTEDEKSDFVSLVFTFVLCGLSWAGFGMLVGFMLKAVYSHVEE